jgi:hypothetical protein
MQFVIMPDARAGMQRILAGPVLLELPSFAHAPCTEPRTGAARVEAGPPEETSTGDWLIHWRAGVGIFVVIVVESDQHDDAEGNDRDGKKGNQWFDFSR